jgi:hypothetical protein
MSKLVWDQIGERLYETGVRQGVLYPMDGSSYGAGEAWNGLTAVNESPSGAEPTALYANDAKYVTMMSAEEFGGTIEAYTYPESFAACNGETSIADGVFMGQQNRRAFGLSYRTTIGNDTLGADYGYKLHLVYGAMVSPSEKNNSTINDSPEAGTMSWEFKTTPVSVAGYKPTAHIYFDSTKVDASKLAALEALLYGTDDEEPKLPTPQEVIDLMKDAA